MKRKNGPNRGFTVYAKGTSQHWYAAFWDTAKKKRVYRRTEFRRDEPAGKRQALIWASGQSRIAEAERAAPESVGWGWVSEWLNGAYGNSLTGKRYRAAWTALHAFLIENQVAGPAAVKYSHALTYVEWRIQHKRKAGKLISRNTAVLEIKIFKNVMQEAVRRELSPGNPLFRAKLRKDPTRHAQPMTDAEIETIRAYCRKHEAHLPVTARWRTVSFEVALHHGCRLRETSVPMSRVTLRPTPDAPNGTIVFDMKGDQMHAVPLHPALVPLIRELHAAGAERTCVLPALVDKKWWEIRQVLKLPHLRFHSTRSTVVTRLAEAGVNQQQVMRYVNHATDTVHRVYQQLSVAGIADVGQQLDFGSGSKPSKPGTPGALRSKTRNDPGS